LSTSELRTYILEAYSSEGADGGKLTVDSSIVDEMMQLADTNKNGELDFDEFKAAMRAGPARKLKAGDEGAVKRYNKLRSSLSNAKYKLAVVQFKVPGAKNGGSDKGPDGNRIDSVPIANGVIEAGGACDLVLYDATQHEAFASKTAKYDALIVRINPGQLSQGTPEGTQARFDELMNTYIAQGKLVWSSPKIQTQMGAKDALVKIGHLNCGLEDTYAYYTEAELIAGFKKTCAFQPRVIKQNRGSAGEGIWLCWLANKDDNSMVPFTDYPAKSLVPSSDGLSVETDASLGDDDCLKLMEMNDNHVEFHTVKEFLTFCVEGPDAEGAGSWTSTFPGKYLDFLLNHGRLLVARPRRLRPRLHRGVHARVPLGLAHRRVPRCPLQHRGDGQEVGR